MALYSVDLQLHSEQDHRRRLPNCQKNYHQDSEMEQGLGRAKEGSSKTNKLQKKTKGKTKQRMQNRIVTPSSDISATTRNKLKQL